jgi:DNA ligase (NAD+)
MNIDGVGTETIDQFFRAGLLTTIADLYFLTEQDILPLDRMAEKSARKAITGIRNSKNVPFERVLFGLGIRYVGVTVAKKLAYHYQNLDNLQKADFDDLIKVDEIGDRIAQSVLLWFKDPENIHLINQLKQAKVKLQIDAHILADRTHILQGKSFVISGVFKEHSRDELKKLIEQNGGKNTSSISKKTTYLVAGDNMGPSKREKATNLGVSIITETEFTALLR